MNTLFSLSNTFKINTYADKANINHEIPPSEKRENPTFTLPKTLSSIAEIILYANPTLTKKRAFFVVLFFYKKFLR